MRRVSADCYFGTYRPTTCQPRRRRVLLFFLASFESTFTFGDALAAQQGKRHQESPLQLHGMVRIGRDLASRGANVLAYSRRGVRHRDAA